MTDNAGKFKVVEEINAEINPDETQIIVSLENPDGTVTPFAVRYCPKEGLDKDGACKIDLGTFNPNEQPPPPVDRTKPVIQEGAGVVGHGKSMAAAALAVGV